jgi:hypothetical protein
MNELPDPFSKDVIETPERSDQEEPAVLSEKDFIHESPSPPKSGIFPFWLWLALLSMCISLVWGSLGWFKNLTIKEIKSRPFLEVTNREFSLFLWQFPSFMRTHAEQKNSYLTGFQYGETFTMDLATTEEFVTAQPEVLFLYHTWKRLLSPDFIEGPIPSNEFAEFLGKVPEWQPSNWKGAPAGYVDLIHSGKYIDSPDLSLLPESVIPRAVRQSFQGWKNYFKQGKEINLLTPTIQKVTQFLERHPNYGRSYWRNIRYVQNREVAGDHYLQSLNSKKGEPDALIPSDDLAPFLKVALYNANQSELKN